MKHSRRSPNYPNGKLSTERRLEVKQWLRDNAKAAVMSNPETNNHSLARSIYKALGIRVTPGNVGLLMSETFNKKRLKVLKKEWLSGATPAKSDPQKHLPLWKRVEYLEKHADAFDSGVISRLSDNLDAKDNITALFESVNDLNWRLTHLEKELGVS